MDKTKILIVDDSEMNRALLIDILEEQYDIVEAADGEEAISILSACRKDFSVMLLDISMPKMDGFEVLARINEQHWNDSLAVIMISADDSPENIRRAYNLGAFDYISRPFDAVVVQRRVVNTMFIFARQQRLEKIIEKQFRDQEQNNQILISILSHLVEFRNGESGAHVIHVNTVTKCLLNQLVQRTKRYNLSRADINLIATASALHDIGKIALPETILNKPGRLTAEEFEIMKTHAVIGAEMLLDLPYEQRDLPLFKVSSQICRWHHERYDGNGYPDKLKGDEIPIAAQVVAVADVYDALTSERCYKPAYSHERAIEMIVNGECGAFNPLLLECLRDCSEILASSLTHSSSPQDRCLPLNGRQSEIHFDGIFSRDSYNFLTPEQQQLLYIDSLTGAYNRHYYDKYFRDAPSVQALVMVDVDDFKHINDQYGHDVGDLALQSISHTFLASVRKTDTVVRYGGDEFVIIFKTMPEEWFVKKMEQIRHAVELIVLERYPELHMTVSMGGVYGTGPCKVLFKAADKMMYLSKATKNKVSVQFLSGNRSGTPTASESEEL